MWTRRATATVVLAIFLYLAATYGELGWLYVLDALAVALLGVSLVLPYLSLRGIEAQRRLPATAHEGEAVAVEIVLRNPGRWGRHLIEVESPFPPGKDLLRLLATAIPPGGEATLTHRPRCRRRGAYALPPLRLRCGAPFGLFVVSWWVVAPAQITVYPETVPLAPSRAGGWGAAEGRLRSHPGEESEFLWTREYRRGDPRRLIHWRSSARRGRLLVKERPRQQEGRLVLLVDAGLGVDEGPWGESTLDVAVRAAASLAVAALERGQPVEMGAVQREEIRRLVPSSPQQALEWLAPLEATGRLPFASLVADVLAQLHSPATAIVILPVPGPRHLAALDSLAQADLRLLLVEPPEPGRSWAEFPAAAALAARWPTYRLSSQDLPSCLHALP